jgi:hypothetical protein
MSQNPKYNFVSPNGWYSLTYPETWKFEIEDDCTTFYKKVDGIGALQISAYETDVPQSAKINLREYLDDENIGAKIKNYFTESGQEIAFCSYRHNSLFTEVWLATKGNHLLFITYNRDLSSRKEEKDVSAIIQSLQIGS